MEVVVKVLEGSMSQIHIVKDDPAAEQKLISVSDTGTGESQFHHNRHQHINDTRINLYDT